MKRSRTAKHWRYGGRFAAVAVMLTLWLWLCALEVSPELHNFIHKDAHSPAHNCLVTQLQHHSVHPGCAPAFFALAPTDWSLLLTHDPVFVPVSFDYRLSPSRAPPAA